MYFQPKKKKNCFLFEWSQKKKKKKKKKIFYQTKPNQGHVQHCF